MSSIDTRSRCEASDLPRTVCFVESLYICHVPPRGSETAERPWPPNSGPGCRLDRPVSSSMAVPRESNAFPRLTAPPKDAISYNILWAVNPLIQRLVDNSAICEKKAKKLVVKAAGITYSRSQMHRLVRWVNGFYPT